jgi:hypothetical protein
MSPEYALDGLFSIKSDVFSFGVVLLEIISGKKNYLSELNISLIGYVSILISIIINFFCHSISHKNFNFFKLSKAWRLWVENKVLDLMDQTLREVCNVDQFVKCVNIGLLCVQEDPNDRPTMSTVVTMLDSEIATVPTPKGPAFVQRRGHSGSASSSTKPDTYTEWFTGSTYSLGGT